MRQHLLNGWLVAALVALVCLLGATAYVEVRTDIPRAACVPGERGVKGPRTECQICNQARCGNVAPRA